MAGIAAAGPVSPFLDVVRRGTPVVWQRVEVLHLDTDCCERIPHGRHYPQGCYFAGAPILADDHTRLGLRPFAVVTAIAVIVWCCAVAGDTGKQVTVLIVTGF